MGKQRQEQQTQQTGQTNQVFDQSQATSQQQQMDAARFEQQNSQSLQNFLNSFANQSNQAENVQSTTGLSALQQPAAQTYFQDLMRQYTSGALAPQPYTGQRVAELTPSQLLAQQMAQNYATGPGTGIANQALVANQRLLDPSILDPSQVPGLQATKAANMQALTRNLTENQLPQIRNQALVGNNFGGSAQGIAEGLATGRTNEAIANANAGLDMGAYSQGLQAMQGALGMAGQTQALGANPAQLVSQVGQQQQNQQQAQLGAQEAQFREQQAAPAQGLSLLQSLMGTQGQYGGTTTGTSTATGQQTGQQQGMQMAQQLASLLGISSQDLINNAQGVSSGTQAGTSSGTTNTQNVNKPSMLQNLGAALSIAMMPFTFGLSGAAAPQILSGGGMY